MSTQATSGGRVRTGETSPSRGRRSRGGPVEPGADQRPEIPNLPRWIPVTALVLSLLGLADSIYLTITHFNPGTLQCQVNSVINCVKVTTSPQSEIFGVIPVALVGLGYFVVVTFVNLPFMWRSF
ncbi:MAG TPA: vitamin K epoxide reductase family protein, partial [Acidimicrobiales bacterium]|nr:vitamin K epoxide reductase family protein [Acidimicrobiales bacterium]